MPAAAAAGTPFPSDRKKGGETVYTAAAMILDPEELEEVSRLRSGSLSEVPFAGLLASLARHERTAVLEIRRGPVSKEIVFEEGVPVDCRSNLVHETLGRFMVSQGKLDEAQHDECLREAVTRGLQVGEVLRERGLIDSYELYRTLQQNLAKKLLDGFTWLEGEFRLRFDLPEVGSPLKVRVPQLIVTGVTRFSPQAQVDSAVSRLVGTRLVLHPAPRIPLEEIRLSSGQAALADLLREPRRLHELGEAAEAPFGEINRLVCALVLLGVVIPEERLSQARETAAATPPPAPKIHPSQPAEPPPSLSPEAAAELRNELMQAYLVHRRGDAFDLLGIPPDDASSAAVVRDRYLDFARRYAPWRFQGGELSSLAEKAEDLFLAGARAFGELSDAEQRNTLLYRRRVLAEEEEKKKASQPAIETDLLDPEKQYRKGLALLEIGKHREALMLLDFAADCDPQNALYRAEAAWCRYLLNPSGGAERALRDLEEALRIDPRCGPAALYAGEICGAVDDWERAETLLRRANQLMAPDRRAIEALKRLQRRRKG